MARYILSCKHETNSLETGTFVRYKTSQKVGVGIMCADCVRELKEKNLLLTRKEAEQWMSQQ